MQPWDYERAAPGAAGIPFGTFRTNAATMDRSTIGWFVPADGQNHTLNIATIAVGGSQPDDLSTSERATRGRILPHPL